MSVKSEKVRGYVCCRKSLPVRSIVDRVSDLCRLLAKHGIADDNVRLGYRLHLTLVRYDALRTEAALLVLSRFPDNELQLSVHLGAVSLVPGDASVRWIALVPSRVPAVDTYSIT
jgi:hypothetical protein